MQLDVEQIARLLRDNAERFRSLARSQPEAVDDDLETQASRCDKLAADLLGSSPPKSLRRPPWMKCALWLVPDLPAWGHGAEEPDVQSPDRRFVEALLAFDAAVGEADDDQWRVTEDEAQEAHFFAPAFLPGRILAHVVKKNRETGETWTAFFHLTEEKSGTYLAKSFDFQSNEVHRLNREAPLQLVGHELEYLRYFMHVVRGPKGAFRLLECEALRRAIQKVQEEVETPPVVNGRVEEPAVAQAWGLLPNLPPTYFVRVTGEGAVVFRASVLYSSMIFKAELLVHPDGTVEMQNDQSLMEQPVEGLAE